MYYYHCWGCNSATVQLMTWHSLLLQRHLYNHCKYDYAIDFYEHIDLNKTNSQHCAGKKFEIFLHKLNNKPCFCIHKQWEVSALN